jgi:ABC-type antimicrobial peptide transport system permease subunit
MDAYQAGIELVGEEVMAELGHEFLPASFIVKLDDVTYAHIFVRNMKAMSNIYEVKYSSEAYERAGAISYTIRYVCGVLTALLGILSLFLISNTIKITVSASKEEVTIMRYIGASESRIKAPFYLQGAFIGFLGAIISFIIAGFGYNYMYTRLEGDLSEYMGVLELVPVPQMLLVLLGVFLRGRYRFNPSIGVYCRVDVGEDKSEDSVTCPVGFSGVFITSPLRKRKISMAIATQNSITAAITPVILFTFSLFFTLSSAYSIIFSISLL